MGEFWKLANILIRIRIKTDVELTKDNEQYLNIIYEEKEISASWIYCGKEDNMKESRSNNHLRFKN